MGLLDDWLGWRQGNARSLRDATRAGTDATMTALRGGLLDDAGREALVNTPAAWLGTENIGGGRLGGLLGAVDDLPVAAARAPDLPAAVRTEDGYTFHRAADGRYVDNLDPDAEDMAFGSFDEMVQALGYRPAPVGASNDIAAKKQADFLASYDAWGVPGPEDLAVQAQNRALDVQERRKAMGVVPQSPSNPWKR